MQPFSLAFILEQYAHVFKNEFNERKVLAHRAGTLYSPRRGDVLILPRVLVKTIDKNGIKQMFEFFYKCTWSLSSHSTTLYCYSEIKMN